MTVLCAFVMLVGVLSGAPDALAQSPPRAIQCDPAASLAATVLPKDKAIAVRLPRFEAAFAGTLRTDARLAALESRHPGVTKAVAAAARDEAAKAYGLAVDRLQGETAALYRSRFTPVELTQLATFFASPTGRMMIDLSMESAGDDATAFEADRQSRLLAKLQNPDARTKADLDALIETGLLPKVRAINPEIAALSQRRFDDLETIVKAALPARIDAAVAAFTKTKP